MKTLARFISIISIVFLPATILAQQDTIAWSPVKLTWEDFQGAVDNTSEFFANTHSEIRYHYHWDKSRNHTYTVSCFFLKDKSWKKPDMALTKQILEHEQGHFDIAEIYARRVRLAFSEYFFTHKHTETTVTDIRTIFNEILDELNNRQETYDTETDHSQDKDKQAIWETKIKEELNSLGAYAK